MSLLSVALLKLKSGPLLFQVAAVHQLGDRHLHKIGVAQKFGPVGIDAAFGFDHHLHGAVAVPAPPTDRVRLDVPQQLHQRHPPA